MLTFGEKIRNLRESFDLTQGQLGERVQMSQRKISYIERDQYEPSISDVIALCRFFSVSADYLLGLNQ